MPNQYRDDPDQLPLLNHPLTAESQFRASDLVSSARRNRGLAGTPVPDICVLEFDSNLTDALITRGEVHSFPEWPCFDTVG